MVRWRQFIAITLQNSGIPPEGFGQRGAGIGQLAGIVRRCEVERGWIGHAVTLAYDYPVSRRSVSKMAGALPSHRFEKQTVEASRSYDIPEGARLAIRPEISREEIIDACSALQGCVVWALNMQEYGGFIVDNSDHPKTYAEGNVTADWDASLWTREHAAGYPTRLVCGD